MQSVHCRTLDELSSAIAVEPDPLRGQASLCTQVGAQVRLYPEVFDFPLIIKNGSFPLMNSAHVSSNNSNGALDGPLREHSQIVNTRHPSDFSAWATFSSRIRFAVILANQNSLRVAGSLNIGQSCPCQKHPCMSTTAWKRGKTRSGLPGRCRSCNR